MTDDKRPPVEGAPESIKAWADTKRKQATLTEADKAQIAAEASDRKDDAK
jgi:hypothetical protein